MIIEPPSFGSYLRHLRSGAPPAAFAPDPTYRAPRPAMNRAELATAARASVGYIQKLEQGHADNPSTAVVDRLADALGSISVERQHLHDLAGVQRGDQPEPMRRQEVTSVQREAADGLHPSLAAYVDEGWNVLYSNVEYRRVFRRITEVGNVLTWFFFVPESKAVMVEWEHEARLTVAWLRALMARRPGNPVFDEVLEMLSRSAEFVRMWELQEVILGRHKPHFLVHDLDLGRRVELLAQVYPIPDPSQEMQLYLGIPAR
ncbi:helix-turn-helix domain-containing protein [Actinopolyspora mzabensis]|nr:helix-turn-helix transcriptional regulator [Actinopolyspora mzabensis]